MNFISLRIKIFSFFLLGIVTMAISQTSEPLNDKHGRRKNMIIREYTTNAKGNKRFMEHMTVYDSKGLKREEKDFTVSGLHKRIMYEYDARKLCVKEIVYDDAKQVSSIRKFTHNADGTKKTQYNYFPNGRLHSTKQFEYTY